MVHVLTSHMGVESHLMGQWGVLQRLVYLIPFVSMKMKKTRKVFLWVISSLSLHTYTLEYIHPLTTYTTHTLQSLMMVDDADGSSIGGDGSVGSQNSITVGSRSTAR